jgi:hypothetical protein
MLFRFSEAAKNSRLIAQAAFMPLATLHWAMSFFMTFTQ